MEEIWEKLSTIDKKVGLIEYRVEHLDKCLDALKANLKMALWVVVGACIFTGSGTVSIKTFLELAGKLMK